ncbi:aldo/keto reductase [Cyclobacterium qasimii]|uniref:Oxidoreductase n=2 Tax=Cyclobacterium qasimii TaxID=1350429 RepID=A0A512C8V8_9BACT|nr:aldo/keto reductase [Cyclobacterium qasimii]EPR68561.1 putative oxidoreductase [Cyclobacterium qasimii M12-11B]GEO20642.1 oxidoreductase [Cyclobacterium qasimii]
MINKALGNTGIEVSQIAFGGVEIGLPYGPGITSEKDMLQENEAIDLLLQALDSGVNFFDTARMYGKSEELIGKAFAQHRNEVVICTKCQHLRDVSGNLPDEKALVKIIRESLVGSLKALGMEALDVLMLHQADIEILQNEAVCRTFEDIKKEGLSIAIGASTYTVEESETAINSGLWEVIQLPYNLLDQRQSNIFDLGVKKGVGMVVRSVLLRGMLSDRGKNLKEPLAEIEKHIAKYAALATQEGLTLPEYATRFVLDQPNVSSVLVGIDKSLYLEKALETANLPALSKKLLAGAIPFPDPEFINIPYWDRMGWL